MKHPILRLVPFLALIGLAFAFRAPAGEALEPATVIVLRHAEAQESTAEQRDPELTPEGVARAQVLARLLSSAGVTQLYSSPLRRTHATLEPLAAELELSVEDYPAQEGERLAAQLRELEPGSIAVVAGHSNTVPAIVKALGGELAGLEEHPRYGPMLGHDEHDRLILVTLPAVEGVAAKTIDLRYGD